MKKLNIILSGTGIVLLSLFSACKDAPDHSDEAPSNPGNLDFSKYMAIGNSITAGYQSGALYQEAQDVAYPALIAKQAGMSDFQGPTLSGEGTGGRLTWDGSFSASGSPVLVAIPAVSSSDVVARASNKNLARAYNNMGIPGALLVIPGTAALGNATDFFNVAVNAGGTDAVVGPGGVGGSRGNGLFAITLRSPGASLWLSMKGFQPKVVSLWLGNNDVLGYATSGGVSPSAPTDAAVFQTKYQQVADSISGLASQPKVVVATVPDVTVIPFFTTVNASLVGKIPSGKIYYTRSGVTPTVDSIYVDAATYASGAIYNRGMITLLGASALGNGVTTFTGLAKALPLGSQYVLDPDEIVTAKTAIAQFNGAIKTIAAAKGWAIVDANNEFNLIAATKSSGKMFQGKTVTVAFITGGLFSYDGVHPSSLGQGILANYMINALNTKYGSSIREVDLNGLPGMKFGKAAPSGIAIDPASIPAESLESMINMLGGSIR